MTLFTGLPTGDVPVVSVPISKSVGKLGTSPYRSIIPPATDTDALQKSVESLKEVVEQMTGQRGDGTNTVASNKSVRRLVGRQAKIEAQQTQLGLNQDNQQQRIADLEEHVASLEARLHNIEHPVPPDPSTPGSGGGAQG